VPYRSFAHDFGGVTAIEKRHLHQIADAGLAKMVPQMVYSVKIESIKWLS
jgi:hypothetical protein